MKYKLTENQIDYIIKNHIFEQLDIDKKEHIEVLNENKAILKIRDLAKGLANQFGDDAEFYYDEFVKQLGDIYKKHGDEGIIHIFKDSSGGIELEPMGHARYIIK